ncbi:uncharacterized protein LOC108337530 isoform X1 [Vigna angularis]|uniref:uncharacterized protein LOC108337530 isoform X1 n=2 Tax=Phaseolus angularis TaxID=3914 RepID=UPI00080A6E56|nr:uncharacterized protein LOC108337530 isoform X1 [Vigna angularis]
MIKTLIVVLCLVIGASPTGHCIRDTLKEDMELERQLKLINKPPVKTIHTKYGDTVDCIDINKQSAFDHPILKNHKLQKKPSIRKPIEKSSMKKLQGTQIFGFVKCPKGTIPIRRTTKEELIQEKQLLNSSIFVKDVSGVHLAEMALSSKYGPYYGVEGGTSIYNPRVTKGQMSLSHVWVENGPIDSNNKISVGWHVSLDLYGDNRTHSYVSWTRDNFHKTGCYNLRCPGFVQTNPASYIGGPFLNTSLYGGPTYRFVVSISQDPKSKNWWIHLSNTIAVGYFPAKLFSNLSSADKVGWGGRTLTPRGSLSPTMGSGYFPDGNFYHACYFTYIYYKNASRKNYGPENYQIKKYVDNPKCFGLTFYGNLHRKVEYCLQFGGPGGDCGD